MIQNLKYLGIYATILCIKDYYVNGVRKFTEGKTYVLQCTHRMLYDDVNRCDLFTGCRLQTDNETYESIPVPTAELHEYFTDSRVVTSSQ